MEISFLILISIFLSFSFLFSGFETAFITLDIDEIFVNCFKFTRKNFVKKPREILNSVILGNNLVNVGIAVFLTGFFIEKTGILNAVLSGTFLSTFLIIILGEILPKSVARKYPYIFFKSFHIFIYIFYILSKPLSYILDKVYSNILKIHTDSPKDEILYLIFTKERRGTIPTDLARALKSSIYFSEKTVLEVLKPRTELYAFEQNLKVEEVIEEVKNLKFSSFPVYEDDLDNIKGLVKREDILEERNKNKRLKHISTNILFFPENAVLEKVVKEMFKKNIFFAIVVDEYGGTTGFFTIEDIAEEIIGEMPTHKGVMIIDGKTRIDDLKEILGISFPKGPYETIAGFLLDLKGDFPEEGEILEYKNYKFQIISKDKKRLKKVKVFLE